MRLHGGDDGLEGEGWTHVDFVEHQQTPLALGDFVEQRLALLADLFAANELVVGGDEDTRIR